ncbi:MAG: recombinase family protein [Bdellovibrionales bacterium]|nr:recombinase family protein [Bdellovibrionales bacterium]
MKFLNYIYLNGRSGPTKGQLLFARAYLSDFVNFFELSHLLNKSVLHQKYLVEGLTIEELSSQFGCGKTTIKKYLSQFNIKKGGHTTHRKNVSYGQKFKPKNNSTEDLKAERRVIDTIVQMYEKEGLVVRAIARVLSSMKVPTKRQGKTWDHSVVTSILIREGVYRPSIKKDKYESSN